jgi:hypothetical protein
VLSQVATLLRGRKRSTCCEYSEDDAGRTGKGLTACADSDVRWETSDCGQSSFSQLKLSEKQAKAISSITTLHIACNAVVNAFQQYEWLARLATAKLKRR